MEEVHPLGPKLFLTTTGGGNHDVQIPIPVEDDREVVRRASLVAANQPKIGSAKPVDVKSVDTKPVSTPVKEKESTCCCTVM